MTGCGNENFLLLVEAFRWGCGSIFILFCKHQIWQWPTRYLASIDMGLTRPAVEPAQAWLNTRYAATNGKAAMLTDSSNAGKLQAE